MAHAALVRSTIAAGRIRRIDTAAAEAAPGVLAVITHENAPSSSAGPPASWAWPRRLRCRTTGCCTTASTSPSWSPRRRSRRPRPRGWSSSTYEPRRRTARHRRRPRCPADQSVGHRHAARGRRRPASPPPRSPTRRPSRPRRTPTTRSGLFATVAAWDGDTVTVHDTTQWTSNVRAGVAAAFELPEAAVRVHAPYVGGGFGAGLRVWPHVILTALAARTVATAGQTGPHPAADVHRHRPPTQHGQTPQDRRHTRRPAGRRSTTRRPRRRRRWTTRTPSRSRWAPPAAMPARTSPPATSSGG